MSGAVKIAQRLDAVRAGAHWAQDFVFTLADRVTPQAAWEGCTAEVILSPRSALLRSSGTVRLDSEHVSVVEGEARVLVRVPMTVTPDFRIADYVIEINRIDADDERWPAAFGDIRVVQGQSQIADGADPEGDVGGLGAVAGSVIIAATGSTYATGTGPQGQPGPPGVTVGPTFTPTLATGQQALWIKTGLGDDGDQIDLILVTGD